MKIETVEKNLNSTYIVILIYALLVCIPFSPILFESAIMKWDLINYYFPYRYFVGNTLQHGKLALWNPYVQLGLPILGDPQSTAWYPITWILGYFWGYDYTIIGIEYLLHLIVAGVGFYLLCKYFKLAPSVSFIAGTSYMLCGFFIGNAQHLSWVVSAAYIPLILLYFIKSSESDSVVPPLKTSIFVFLLLTGGYPAFTFNIFYFCLIYGLVMLAKSIIRKDWKRFKTVLRNYSIAGISSLLLSAAFIYSLILVSSQFSRSGGIPLDLMFTNPFPPIAIVSFVLPLTTLKLEYFPTDISMTNAYFGIVAFVFFIAGLFLKKTKTQIVLLILFCFFMITAFGQGFFLRKFLYDWVPFMNLFRFPALYRLFFIISALIFASTCLQSFLYGEKKEKNREVLEIVIRLLMIILSFVLAFSFLDTDFKFFPIRNNFTLTANPSLSKVLFFQSLVQLINLFLLRFLITSNSISRSVFLFLLLLLATEDMAVQSKLNSYTTVLLEEKIDVDKYNKTIKSLNNINEPQFMLAPSATSYPNVYPATNENIFYKKVSFDGYNPFTLKRLQALELMPLKDTILKNSIAYLACTIVDTNNVAGLKLSALAIVEDTAIVLKQFTAACTEVDSVKEIKADANEVNVKVYNRNKDLLVLMQNYLAGWTASVNGKPATIYVVNKTMMAVIVPPGENHVQFMFAPKYITFFLWVSIISLTIVIIVILFPRLARLN